MSCNNREMSDKLLLFLEENLPEEEYNNLSDHLSTCTECRKELDDVSEILATVDVTAKHIKERWIHPTSEELLDFVLTPGNLSKKMKDQISQHLSLCRFCSEEALLIEESPVIEADEASETELPDTILTFYKKTYKNIKNYNNEEAEPESQQASFWDRIRIFNRRYLKTPFASAAALIIVAFFIGIFAGPRIFPISNRVVSPANENHIYSDINFDNATIEDKENLVRYLQIYGISSHLREGQILVRDDQKEDALQLIPKFRNSLIIASDSNPARSNPEGTWIMNVSKKSESEKNRDDNFWDSMPEGEDSQQLPPDLLEALDKSRDYPLAGESPAEPDPVNHNEIIIADEIDDIIDINSLPIQDLNSKTAIRIAAYMPRPSQGKPGNVLSFDYGRGPVLTAVSLIEEPQGPFTLSRITEPISHNILGADLEERDKVTTEIKNNFKTKIENVLSRYPGFSDCSMYINVTLGFTKDDESNYTIHGVKILISHDSQLSAEKKEKIITDIKKEIDWNKTWDGDIGFASIKK